MRWTVIIGVCAAALVTLGCETETQESEGAMTEAELTSVAARAYDPANYDTVDWATDEAAIERGGDIYKWVCAECHGPAGAGDGGRVIDGDTIRPPSFQREDWPYADDPDELQRKVFVGNSLGMPHWGLRQMRPRDIVAVEKFIRLDLIQDDASAD